MIPNAKSGIMESEQKWTKIALSKEQTEYLYNILRTLVNDANKISHIVGVDSDLPPAIQTFDGGRFVIEDDLEPIQGKKSGNKRSSPKIKPYGKRHRLNLSVIKVHGTIFYRLFVSHKSHKMHWYDIKNDLTTDINMLQISSKERILTKLFTADKHMPIPYNGKFVTYNEYYEIEKPLSWYSSMKTNKLFKMIEYTWDDKMINDCQTFIESITEDIIPDLIDHDSFWCGWKQIGTEQR